MIYRLISPVFIPYHALLHHATRHAATVISSRLRLFICHATSLPLISPFSATPLDIDYFASSAFELRGGPLPGVYEICAARLAGITARWRLRAIYNRWPDDIAEPCSFVVHWQKRGAPEMVTWPAATPAARNILFRLPRLGFAIRRPHTWRSPLADSWAIIWRLCAC